MPVSDAGAASLGGKGWIVGGWRGSAVTQILDATLVSSGAGTPSPSARTTGDASRVRPFAGLIRKNHPPATTTSMAGYALAATLSYGLYCFM